MFAGFLDLGSMLHAFLLVKNSQESPTNPDAPPTFKTKLDADPGLFQYSIATDPSNGSEVGRATACSSRRLSASEQPAHPADFLPERIPGGGGQPRIPESGCVSAPTASR